MKKDTLRLFSPEAQQSKQLFTQQTIFIRRPIQVRDHSAPFLYNEKISAKEGSRKERAAGVSPLPLQSALRVRRLPLLE